jgi:WhiB family redox-sensing transcriptional regulator
MAGSYAPDTESSSADAWHHDARCRTGPGIDPDLWHPAGNTGHYLLQIEEAKAECRMCPVMEICGQVALANRESSGVWGAMSEDERDQIFRRQRRRPVAR